MLGGLKAPPRQLKLIHALTINEPIKPSEPAKMQALKDKNRGLCVVNLDEKLQNEVSVLSPIPH